MRSSSPLFYALLSTPLVMLAAAAVAAADDDGRLSGGVRLGYRAVDVDGRQEKYDEDLNLDDGVRLFELDFDFVAPEEMRDVVDRVELDMVSFGGDPFETLHFSAYRRGHYDFRYNRSRSQYFYEDVLVPLELFDPSLSNGGDFHTFDFDRVRDSASLDLHLGSRTRLEVGFDRFTKRGESTTTLDIQRDEFELDRPIDESSNDLSVGLEVAWTRWTLVLEERARDYENNVEIFLPGASLGESPDDSTTLDFFFLDQPYEIDSQQHSVKLNGRPNDRLIFRAAAIFQDLDLEVEAAESSSGTTFQGNPVTTDLAGGGEIERESEIFEVELSYLINDRVALVGSARRQSLDQDGVFAFDDALNQSVWDIETTGYEVAAEADVSRSLTVAAGVRFETRDVAERQGSDGLPAEAEEESTDQTGFFASLGWRPAPAWRLEAELEDSSYDDPFTLTSPTDRQRLRLRVSYKPQQGFYAQGTWIGQSFENKDSDWDADYNQLSLRLGYRQGRYDVQAGYSAIDSERQIDQLVTTLPGFGGGQTFLFPILYDTESDFFDARLRCKLNDRVAIGGEARLYEANGSFAVERDDLRGFVEIGFAESYRLQLAYRTIDYDEDLLDVDDYEADIAEISIGYEW